LGMDEESRQKVLAEKGVSKRTAGLKDTWMKVAAIAIFLVIAGAVALYFLTLEGPDWGISKDGLIRYKENRGIIVYSENPLGSDGDYVSKITFDSRGATVYGLLRIPKAGGKVPGIVLLPGAGVTKENEQRVAQVLSEMGYATLTIDQRGIGESKELTGDISTNYEYYRDMQGEPQLYKMAYDALKAYDVLKERQEIDREKIAFMGESMGGRFAIIAAALQNTTGVIGISTGGYGLGNSKPDNNKTLFMRSLDPDAYISGISPQKVLIIHSSKDNVIALENAQRTFNFASEPKRIEVVNCSLHGYCDDMKMPLKEGLKWVFSQ
jgi:uncharacterized protein